MRARETKQHNNKQHNKEKAVREVTAVERAAMEKHLARLKAKRSIRFKVSKDGEDPQIQLDHPDKLVGEALVMDVLASADGDFVNGILSQLASASGRGQDISEHGVNFMLSVIKGIEPRDQLEAMLAAQMAVVHVASMTFAHRLVRVEDIQQQDSAERAFNKLTRTFAMQMEALKRYRTGAEQKVTLQRVSVAEGGQAIIGNVTHAPRKNGQEQTAQEQTAQEQTAQEKAAKPPPTLPNTNVVPMPMMGKGKERDSLSVRRKSSK
jgi:hypothetical protein